MRVKIFMDPKRVITKLLFVAQLAMRCADEKPNFEQGNIARTGEPCRRIDEQPDRRDQFIIGLYNAGYSSTLVLLVCSRRRLGPGAFLDMPPHRGGIVWMAPSDVVVSVHLDEKMVKRALVVRDGGTDQRGLLHPTLLLGRGCVFEPVNIELSDIFH